MSVNVVIGKEEYFKGIKKIQYEGPDSKNPLAFKYYDENRVVAGKPMKDHFKFAIAYWHSFCGQGLDMFGAPTKDLPWNQASSPMEAAKKKLDAAFEFITKLGVHYYCFHDRDLAPEGENLKETEKNLKEMVKIAKEKQEASGVKLLWGTANLFSHPRYMNGAATNPDFRVVAHAASQVQMAIDATIELDGENYVFWGGREGYDTLHNTDIKRELDHLAIFLQKVRDYGRTAGFKGHFLIEPKPKEPTKHQYDYDVSTVIGFIKQNGLEKDFRLNIENNHATLAMHTFTHEVLLACEHDLLGGLDINQGDLFLGWDTDEFLHDLYQATELMLILLQHGGMKVGGMNFDAKTRRNSTDLEDLFIAHISSMDTLARGLLIANEILEKSDYLKMRKERYASFDSGDGAKFEKGELSLPEIAKLAYEYGEPELISGKQELFEALINMYIK
ncbi:MAG: xylose isomerase [Candidatus Marinimicrobia bacterium]|nr:xylose isomerase [Candidatus Neomarinimicrobiota bacterium]